MNRPDIADSFYALVAPSHPNEWELEDIFDRLSGIPDTLCVLLLNQIPAVWPVSHSLCFGYLEYGAGQIEHLPPDLLPEWVRQILSSYERGGLREAELFMSDTQANFLARYQNVSRASLADLNGRLTHYIRGISGRPLSIREDSQVWTDTDTVYLPPELSICATGDENRLLYKFLLTYQSTLIQMRVFELFADQDETDVSAGITSASDCGDVLLRVFLFIKGTRFIKENLPGLWSRSAALVRSQFESDCAAGINRILRANWDHGDSVAVLQKSPDASPLISLDEFSSFYDSWQRVEMAPLSLSQRYLLGELNGAKAVTVIARRREHNKRAFVKMLARILPNHQSELTQEADRTAGGNRGKNENDGAVAVISESLEKGYKKEKRRLLQIDNSTVVVPDELAALADSIVDDLGSIPAGYVQAASGLSGGGMTAGQLPDADAFPANAGSARGYAYDEWDCRRNGYRHDWCTVLDEELPVVKSDFISRTLHKHNGLRKRLRVQFEMMRSAHQYVRRQRDGDDLDLDAIIDAMGDRAAGTTVGERLFVRLQRDKRDITTLFLIDMSNSTSGWIGTFIKEALVLLCEAMEKVGDRYGLYGFSGMRRSRCKLYHVKTIEESYDDSVRERISAIGPKDYTRMAPAIRHLTSILEQSDAATRLLIILSDGKPEDYDGYNGEYAIEDTRKALLEAQGKRVKPFCITVDKQAHDYLDHMCGAGNYIFINEIANLPAKMSQIYRLLTR